jgi:pyrroloquinoline quinone (PQQ) biosynthesis protein C
MRRTPEDYPRWIQDLIGESTELRLRVSRHEAWRRMADGSITPLEHRHILVGFWPLIDRFPQFLALNLLKTCHGRDAAIDAARTWLAKNLRVEQKHAEWFLDWAEVFGTPRSEMLDGARPVEMDAITDWCWHVCQHGDLAEAMAATNYAIEGATGEWTPAVANSEVYPSRIPAEQLERGMRWLRVHADYDDAHPWDALDLISGLAGPEPAPARVRGIRDAVCKSYDLYRLAADVALERAAEPPVRLRTRRPFAPAADSQGVFAGSR